MIGACRAAVQAVNGVILARRRVNQAGRAQVGIRGRVRVWCGGIFQSLVEKHVLPRGQMGGHMARGVIVRLGGSA